MKMMRRKWNKVLTPTAIAGLNSDLDFLKISTMSDTEPQTPEPLKPSTKTSTVPLHKRFRDYKPNVLSVLHGIENVWVPKAEHKSKH